MDYLRSLGGAATSLLQKGGISLPFILGERVRSFDGKSIWSLHDAVKRVSAAIFFMAGHLLTFIASPLLTG
jgi:hypothetical protein